MPKYKGIIKRGKLYYYRIYRNSQQREYGGYKTAEAANRERTAHLKRLDDQDLEPSNITLEDFIIQYLKEYEIPNNRRSTAIKSEGMCRNHIIPELGHMRLRDIKPFHLVQFKNKLVKNTTTSVAFNTMRTLRKILNMAVEWEFLVYSPLKTRLPPAPDTEHSILTPERLFWLVDELRGREKYVVAIAGFAGLRRSEIFGLQWPDVDFKTNTICLRRQNIEGEIVPYLKGKKKDITIPIWKNLAMMLKEWKLQSGSPEWVFLNNQKKPVIGINWVNRYWQEIKKKYELPDDLRFHDLRHTFASILLAEGAQPGDVQKLMRHASVQTTIDIYRHILPGQLEANFDIFSRLYREKNSNEGEGK